MPTLKWYADDLIQKIMSSNFTVIESVEKKHRVDRQGSPEVINFRILSLIPLGSLWITLQGLYSLLRIAWMRKLTSRNLDDSIWKTKGQAFNQLD